MGKLDIMATVDLNGRFLITDDVNSGTPWGLKLTKDLEFQKKLIDKYDFVIIDEDMLKWLSTDCDIESVQNVKDWYNDLFNKKGKIILVDRQYVCKHKGFKSSQLELITDVGKKPCEYSHTKIFIYPYEAYGLKSIYASSTGTVGGKLLDIICNDRYNFLGIGFNFLWKTMIIGNLRNISSNFYITRVKYPMEIIDNSCDEQLSIQNLSHWGYQNIIDINNEITENGFEYEFTIMNNEAHVINERRKFIKYEMDGLFNEEDYNNYKKMEDELNKMRKVRWHK